MIDWVAMRHQNLPAERFMVECPACGRIDRAHLMVGEWDEAAGLYTFKCCGARAHLGDGGARSWVEAQARPVRGEWFGKDDA